jgi:hypothetical protein
MLIDKDIISAYKESMKQQIFKVETAKTSWNMRANKRLRKFKHKW